MANRAILTLPAILALALVSAASAREEAQPLASVDASLSVQQADEELARAQIIAESFVSSLAEEWQVSQSYLSPEAEMCSIDTCMSHRTFRIDLENWPTRKCRSDTISPAQDLGNGSIMVRVRWYCSEESKHRFARLFLKNNQIVAIVTEPWSVEYKRTTTEFQEAGAN